jgi:uncharacterized integral membrane protein
MRQVNFVVIFVICLALLLFGIENTEPVLIQVASGLQIKAPLAVELVLAMGIGATLAWVFSVWNQLQSTLQGRQELQVRADRIEALEQELAQYKVELQADQPLLAGSAVTHDVEATEVFAN